MAGSIRNRRVPNPNPEKGRGDVALCLPQLGKPHFDALILLLLFLKSNTGFLVVDALSLTYVSTAVNISSSPYRSRLSWFSQSPAKKTYTLPLLGKGEQRLKGKSRWKDCGMPKSTTFPRESWIYNNYKLANSSPFCLANCKAVRGLSDFLNTFYNLIWKCHTEFSQGHRFVCCFLNMKFILQTHRIRIHRNSTTSRLPAASNAAIAPHLPYNR